MIDTMREYSACGLAAPQVHESLRIFVAHLDSEGRGESEPIAIVNPANRGHRHRNHRGMGRLSQHSGHPRHGARAPRRSSLSALDRHGKRIEIKPTDFPARVIQHETDHLDGVLFFDRMRSFESLTYMEEFSRYHARREKDDEDEE